LLRDVILVVNSLYRANWFASATIHTLIWMNVKHPVALVDAVHGALFNAGLVF
jgi:hypothetical protein